MCYYNLKTGEIKSFPNPDDAGDSDEEGFWATVAKEVEDNRSDYFEFEKMDIEGAISRSKRRFQLFIKLALS